MATIPTPGSVVRHVRKTVTFDGTAGAGEAGTRIPVFTTTGEIEIIGRPRLRTGTALTVSPDAATAMMLTVADETAAENDRSILASADSVGGDDDLRNVAAAGSWWQAHNTVAEILYNNDVGMAIDSNIQLALVDYNTFEEANAAVDVISGTVVIDIWYRPITDDGALAGDDHDADYDDYIEARVAAALATYDPPTKAELDSGLAGLLDSLAEANRIGTAQAGGASTITLDSGASATDDFYNGCIIVLMSGTGSDMEVPLRTRRITDYVGSTKVATVDSAWGVQPSTDTVFLVFGKE